MLDQWKVREQINYIDIIRKGTVGILITIIGGLLFGKENMMIAFVIVLGANIYDKENLRVKTLQKILKLIVRDILIVCVAYIASRSVWWGIPINLIALFIIIYSLVSPYDQISYKTFMMLYVFSQYSHITLSELPDRLLLVAFAVGGVFISSLLHQMRNKAILDPNIGKAWGLINEQTHNILDNRYNEELNHKCKAVLNEVAHTIYKTGYKQYFTTQQGKIQFHFYMNISYFNILLEEINRDYQRQDITKCELETLVGITDFIHQYFRREVKREEVLKNLEKNIHSRDLFKKEIMEVLKALYKNFKEIEKLNYKKKNTVYGEWQRTSLNQLYNEMQNIFNPKSMRVNFAIRLAVILTLSLVLAYELGFHKIIWAIIPIMSATRPYYEDTIKRKKERFKSNVLACVVVGIIMNIDTTQWLSLLLFGVAFYGVYAFKDYYRISFFITILSMCLSSYSEGINSLIFYRLMYLIVGIVIVELVVRVKPYKLEDGIKELVGKIDSLVIKLEKQASLSFQGEENSHIIRETIIHSALLCEHLVIHNKSYQDDRINQLIDENTDFVVRLGYQLLIKENNSFN